jgi:hypothetical protein
VWSLLPEPGPEGWAQPGPGGPEGGLRVSLNFTALGESLWAIPHAEAGDGNINSVSARETSLLPA